MNIQNILPFLSAAVLAVLTFDLLRRHAKHHGRHTHLLVWAVGLGMFMIASLSEGLLGLFWNEAAFRAWYLFGAILSAAWIGQGTVYLLFRRNWVKWLTLGLVIASVGVGAWLLGTPVSPTAFQPGTPIGLQYGQILPQGAPVRLSTIPFNLYGTIALVGGALWSGYLFWRKRVLPNRVIGNVLIAAGSLAIASASSLARIGSGQFLATGQLLFALLLYVGFIQANKPAAVEELTPASAQGARAE